MSRRVLPLLVVLATGCATLKYREPTEGPRARVRFSTTSSGNAVVYAYDVPNCRGEEHEWMRLRAGPLVRTHPKRLGMPLWDFHDNGAKEVWVRTDVPLYGRFLSGRITGGLATTSFTCTVAFDAALEEGADYDVEFESDDEERCQVTVSRLIERGGDFSRKRIAVFDTRTTGESAGCMHRFE